MRCPRCDQDLAPLDRTGFTVDGCASCGGIWFDKGELERELVRVDPSGSAPAPVEQAVRYLKCPRCDTLMTRRNYERFSGAILDTCGAHGVWADQGEVDRARAFLNTGGVTKRHRKEEEEKRADEARDRLGTDTSARTIGEMAWYDLPFLLL